MDYQEVGGGGGDICRLHIRGSVMVVVFCKKVTAVVGNNYFYKGTE